ncbi:aec77 [Escherichia coli]|nr:aec77 [Escherichia coli]
MKLALTLEADSVNVQALNMGRIVVDVDGVNLSELINKVSENGYSLRVVDKSDQHATSAYFHERRSLNNFHRDRVITFEQIAE